MNPIEAKNSLTEYYKKTSLTDKYTATTGRARKCLLRIVAWALPTESSVWFSSRAITWRFFRGQSPRYGWVRSSETCIYRFQTTFLCFMVDERESEISKQFPFKYKKFS